MSGIKSFKLYYYDTMQEVTEDEGLVYKDDNTISFKSMNTFNLITYEPLCKERVHKFKRVIKFSTWHRVEER